MTDRMLISFNHAVAIMLDGRVIMIGAAICEDIGQIKTEVRPKDAKPEEDDEPNPVVLMDVPMFLRVISLGDGKILNQPVDLMVKWNNISAICELK